jgi:pyruvate formate lyase activating enzyme
MAATCTGVGLRTKPTGAEAGLQGFVFDIMRFSLHDGPGIRTAVFLKGCPLSCWWCHNPESRSTEPDLIYSQDRCACCGSCVAACANHAITWNNGPVWDRQLCRHCGDCAEACPSGARQLVGRWMSVEQVLEAVKRDLVFFDESGGGVTVSGGEPLMQAEFVEGLLEGCRANGIHTAVETCGVVSRKALLRVSEQTDLFLYDVKLMDSAKHRKYCGAPNETILGNLSALAEVHKAIVVRIPIIPGINDDNENLEQTRRFLSPLGIFRVDLLPYHEIGVNKYKRLGMEYRLEGLKPPASDDLKKIAEEFERDGFAVRVGG